MKSGTEDLFIGGLLVNPAKVFTATEIPVFKGYRQKLYGIVREEFMDTTGIDPYSILVKFQKVAAWFTVGHILDLMDTYSSYVERRKKGKQDHGTAYCPWPPDPDDYAVKYAILVEAFGEEKVAAILVDAPAAETRTTEHYYRSQLDYEQSERWFAQRVHEYAEGLEAARKSTGVGEQTPPPQPITYDDLPF
jgi:hypothetical protein